MIAYITQTVLDGTVVRWCATTDGPEIASASRRAVLIHANDVPVEVRDAAAGAHRELSRNGNADVRHYATHERRTPGAPLTPIEKGGA